MRPMKNLSKYTGLVRGDEVALAADPAPSLLSYRMQRLWLTPLFRVLVRVGLPTFGVLVLIMMFLTEAENRDYLLDVLREAQASVQNQPVHQLQTLTIDGASPPIQNQIRAKFGGLLPTSAFELDLKGMRVWIEAIPSVEHASVFTSTGGLLAVQVTEIQPEFIWRSFEGLQLISSDGKKLREVSQRADFGSLPLIAGEGASEALSEARALLATAAPISDRLRGLVRIGERRWDLVLLDGQTIALPEANPEQVLAQVIVLSAAQDLFERDILLMDFRNPRRPTLRLRPQALAGLKQVKGVIFSEITK